MNSSGLKRYLLNTYWLFTTQGVRLLIGLFISLWVARYLGPEQYGTYNYVMSWIYIFVAISSFGITDILIKKLVENKNMSSLILNNAFYLRIMTGTISFLLLATSLYLNPQSAEIEKYICIVSPILLFHSFDIIDFFYIAEVKAKESALVRILQLILSAGIKVYLIKIEANLIWFIIMTVFDSVFYAIVIYLKYTSNYNDFIFKRPELKEIKDLALQSFPLMTTALSTILLSRSDQIIIGNLISQEQLGFYSSAIKIIEIISIFSLIVTQSFFPAIINSKTNLQKYYHRFVRLSRLLLFSNIIFAFLLFYFSELIIRLLFGENFLPSKDILSLLAFTLPLIGMQNISYRWYLAENLQKLLILKSILLPTMNIVLNFYLIPIFGIQGAAYASITTYLTYFLFFELLFKKTRICFLLNIGIVSKAVKK